MKENLLGDAANIRVATSKQGPFEPLRQHPEFRDLVLEIDHPNTVSDSMEKTLPPSSVTTVKTAPGPLPRSGPIKSPLEIPKPPNGPGPVFLKISEDDQFDTGGGDWARYLLFMVAGMALGIVGYFLLLRVFNIRLF